MTLHRLLASLALLVCSAAFSAGDDAVELSYRLRPDQSVIGESTDEAISTIRVLEDRGIVAKSTEQGRTFPVTLHLVKRMAHRLTTGMAHADGSFPVEMELMARSTHLRLPSGEERTLPDKAGLAGLSMKARADSQGRFVPGSATLAGGSGDGREAALAMLVSVLEQASSIPTITVRHSEATPQTVRMQLPVAGLTTMELTMHVANRLLEVVDGVAKISMIYTFDFGVPTGPMKIQADGTGGGTLLYEIASRVARRTDTSTLMSFTVETPEGTLGFEMNARQAQVMRDAPRE